MVQHGLQRYSFVRSDKTEFTRKKKLRKHAGRGNNSEQEYKIFLEGREIGEWHFDEKVLCDDVRIFCYLGAKSNAKQVICESLRLAYEAFSDAEDHTDELALAGGYRSYQPIGRERKRINAVLMHVAPQYTDLTKGVSGWITRFTVALDSLFAK